jgi:Domain of unknown function (DUF4145)
MPLNLKAADVLTGLSRCPHCSIAHPNFMVKATTNHFVEGAAGNTLPLVWNIYCCHSCGGGVLIGMDGHHQVWQAHPSQQQAHVDIPEPARAFLQQAMDTLHAPDAASVMAGSAVDAMLKHLKLTDGSLYSRIDRAVEDHTITKAMGDWAHEVRLGSNRPRHADKEKPHVLPEEAKQSVQFAEALGYFLFVLSARIERGTKDAKSASKA